ncbi:TOPRIM nucleotidyl transferase/hydrolase domain-containing protein [Nocardia vinacea]|uniref:TOPRIM nucleotidyl transferase/hydrolase domain-containing protein n=1 Tax=Nocardia vinacea TaxID=96468 RepID=UPI003AF225CF
MFGRFLFRSCRTCVEGDTDKVVIEALAERCGMPLDAVGVSVLCMGADQSPWCDRVYPFARRADQ